MGRRKRRSHKKKEGEEGGEEEEKEEESRGQPRSSPFLDAIAEALSEITGIKLDGKTPPLGYILGKMLGEMLKEQMRNPQAWRPNMIPPVRINIQVPSQEPPQVYHEVVDRGDRLEVIIEATVEISYKVEPEKIILYNKQTGGRLPDILLPSRVKPESLRETRKRNPYVLVLEKA